MGMTLQTANINPVAFSLLSMRIDMHRCKIQYSAILYLNFSFSVLLSKSAEKKTALRFQSCVCVFATQQLPP